MSDAFVGLLLISGYFSFGQVSWGFIFYFLQVNNERGAN
jgi:hypothetical protein